MARKSMVTRTITTTHAEVMCLNVTTGNPENKTVVLGGTYKDNKAVLKAAKAVLETDELKAVHVVSTEERETLYGMTEQKFIEMSEVLTPRGSKTDDNDNE